MMAFDLIIIGAGPAGISAGIYAARKNMSLLVISRDIGGQAAWSGDIENYAGFQFVTGPELSARFKEHIDIYDIKVNEPEEAVSLDKRGDTVIVKTDKAEYEAKAVIIASGKRSKELGVPGEREFKNKGVAYCAVCDGPLFKGKEVAVVGGGNSALDAAISLDKIVSGLCIINNANGLTGDEVMQKALKRSGKVRFYNNSSVTSIKGDKLVRAVEIDKGGARETIAVEGVFIEIGLIPNSGFANIVKKNGRDEIEVNCACETNIPGVFAAGDVTNVAEKQIIVAAGEGAKAALSAFHYLVKN